jgi:NAD(P)-dependent dehydrogenase (short-subunit alcohol dehydrogenase family)
MFDLTGKAALVTGASRGIGRNVAICLAQAGADVAAVGRDQTALAESVAAIEKTGRKALALIADVTKAETVEAAVSATERAFGKIDIVVCNAGVQRLKPFLDMTPGDWRSLISTNLEGAIITLQATGRRLVRQGFGSVITMGSVYGFVGASGNSIYCLTKGGLIQLAKALAIEWARYKVRVNTICPGWVETDLTKPFMTDPKTFEKALRQIPLRRPGQPEDIGPMAVYLASDSSSYVTGQTFVIDGGRIAH